METAHCYSKQFLVAKIKLKRFTTDVRAYEVELKNLRSSWISIIFDYWRKTGDLDVLVDRWKNDHLDLLPFALDLNIFLNIFCFVLRVSAGGGETVRHECRFRGCRFGVRTEGVRREEEGLGRRLRQEGPSAGRAGGHFRYALLLVVAVVDGGGGCSVGVGADVVVSPLFHCCAWLSIYIVSPLLVPGPNTYLVLGTFRCQQACCFWQSYRNPYETPDGEK